MALTKGQATPEAGEGRHVFTCSAAPDGAEVKTGKAGLPPMPSVQTVEAPRPRRRPSSVSFISMSAGVIGRGAPCWLASPLAFITRK